ncbi:hypothetical protein [Pedobacter agri]|uniref:hypothetical protein n=1 Tax=Pedobacter agri TaxID=454586 RepID=UPI00293044C4|nr:hypothetical protein [Pedobacter agri]
MENQKNHALRREPAKTEKLSYIVSGADYDQRTNNKLLRIQTRIGSLLNVPSDYHILLYDLKQVGGVNLFRPLEVKENSRCGFLDAGSRSSLAISLARNYHEVEIIGSSRESNYRYVPNADWIPFNISFLHLTSTNEKEGNRKTGFPKIKTPMLLDMSSDLFSTKVMIEDFAMIYAVGNNQIIPDDLCLVIIKNRFLTNLAYRLLAEPGLVGKGGRVVTGVFKSLFLLDHNLRELEKTGGITEYRKRYEELSEMLYREIERNSKFCYSVNPSDRAVIAVRFSLSSSDEILPFAMHVDAGNLSMVIRCAHGEFLVLIEKFSKKEIMKLICLMQEFELK